MKERENFKPKRSLIWIWNLSKNSTNSSRRDGTAGTTGAPEPSSWGPSRETSTKSSTRTQRTGEGGTGAVHQAQGLETTGGVNEYKF